MGLLSAVKILVVGDVMLDEYIQGTATRISPEAPVPVLRVHKRQYTLGGAANVAANLQTLGCDVHLLGAIGGDEAGEHIQRLLSEQGITHTMVSHSSGTIHKVRLIGQQGTQMLRYDIEEPVSSSDAHVLEQIFYEKIAAYDGVIFSDYAKGTLQQVTAMIHAAKQANTTVFVDPKLSDLSVYAGADYLKPNSKELSQLLAIDVQHHNYLEPLLAQMTRHRIHYVLHTRGEAGMALYSQRGTMDAVIAESVEVFDVTGAGDTVMAVFAASILRGDSPASAIRFANGAASIVVKKHGVATVTAQAVFARDSQHETSMTISAIAADKARGARVVMTNGCFDILHAGHVTYLERAKALGDILVVAVNTDDSITQLKGPTRPINSLVHRMRLLHALQAVDYVVSFNAPTPYDIIDIIRPDVLVKGADYAIDDIVGADLVQGYGGKVQTIPLVTGLSTTAILDAITQ